jgi:hypothetical protein
LSAAEPAEEEPTVEEQPAVEEQPTVAETPPTIPFWRRWFFRAGIGLTALLLLAGIFWGSGVWQTIWPTPTPTAPPPTVTPTAIVLPTIPPLPPATAVPLVEVVEQPVRRESAFAGGWVTVVLRTVEYSPDKITLRWALVNEGMRPVSFPLTVANITIKDNVGNLYEVDEALSDPPVLLAQPGERLEGSCTVPRPVSPDALTLRIWVNGEPFEGQPKVWPVNVTGRD